MNKDDGGRMMLDAETKERRRNYLNYNYVTKKTKKSVSVQFERQQ